MQIEQNKVKQSFKQTIAQLIKVQKQAKRDVSTKISLLQAWRQANSVEQSKKYHKMASYNDLLVITVKEKAS